MLQILQNITTFFNTSFQVIRGIFSCIGHVLEIVGKGVAFLVVIIGHLPIWFTAPVTALVLVSAIYKVLGREGQD